MHPTGFPAYVVVGWLASLLLTPFGEPALRMNLLSALLVAGSAAGTVLVGRRLFVPAPVAAAAGFGLAVTPIAWEIGVAADAHALHLGLVVLLTALLLGWEHRVDAARDAARGAAPAGGTPSARSTSPDRWLVAAAAVFGVAVANHSLTLLLVPPVALYVLAVDWRILTRPRVVAACLAAVIGVATLLYLQLPLRSGIWPAPLIYGRPNTWEGFSYIVLAEQFRGSIVDPLGNLGGKLQALLELAWEQLGPLVILLPAGLVATARRSPRYALLSALAVTVTCFFAASYVNADISRYYLGPAFFAWTWLAVLAAVVAEAVADALPGPRRVEAVIAVALSVLLLVPTASAFPERRAAVDRSWQTGARQWLDSAFAAFEPDAVVVSWWSFSTTLWYGRLVEGRRTDITIIDDRTLLDEQLGDVPTAIDRYLGTRPVYLIRVSTADIDRLATRYALARLAAPDNIYRVLGRLEATG
jgi:4-amino-4-deoxy-L-arabinose transferase-like glycosyltransferase